MAYFLATNVLSTTPPEKTPCLVSSGSQIITFPTINGNQPYIIDTKLRWQSNSLEVSGVYLMGNAEDTSYGGGWYLKHTMGGSGTPYIRIYDAHGSKIGDINPYTDIWFDVLCGPKRTKFYNVNTSYGSMPGDVKDYPMALFGISQFPDKLASIALARTKVTLEDVTVMDLVPVNEFAKAVDLLNNGEYTGYNWLAFSSSISSLTPIRDILRLDARYLDDEGVMHYAEPYTISLSDFASASYDVRPYTTYDNGAQNQWVITNNRLYYQGNSLPSHGVKAFADVYITGSTKEGCFYDTVNDKYYFSETSTPLVYTEL